MIAPSGFTVSVAVDVHPAPVVYTIVEVPPPVPTAIPLEPPIVVTDRLLLVHAPPVVALLRVVELPWQIVVMPVIGLIAFTVNGRVAIHPRAVVYFMLVKPAVSPETMPDELIVATPVLVLLHAPPGVASLSVTEFPMHTLRGPIIGPSAFTVTTVVVKQPPGVVYVIVLVPVPIPEVEPVDVMVATEVLLLAHVPLGVKLLSIVALPWHMVVVPVIG